jgi:hypothetical protein
MSIPTAFLVKMLREAMLLAVVDLVTSEYSQSCPHIHYPEES